jgi:peptide/nickel transport system ATP-binding protein
MTTDKSFLAEEAAQPQTEGLSAGSADAPFLVVEDLTVKFPTADGLVHAVSDLSYTLEQGRTLGIV